MIRPIGVVTLLGALLCQASCAQPRTPGTETARAEAARIEEALAAIEARALSDPHLRSMDQALGEELMAGMVRADAGLAAARERLALLDGARTRAIAAGDAAAAAEAARRIALIERRFVRAQAAALRDVSLAERVERFHARLRRHMVETDQAAGVLLRRYAELQPLLGP